MPQRGDWLVFMNTPPPRSGKVKFKRVQKTLFPGSYGGMSCASGTQKADAEILRAHHATFAGLSVDGLGRALFSSTLARVFSRGPLRQLKG